MPTFQCREPGCEQVVEFEACAPPETLHSVPPVSRSSKDSVKRRVALECANFHVHEYEVDWTEYFRVSQ